LIDFFTLRPTFTLWGLRVVWLLVLLQQAIFTVRALSTFGRFGSGSVLPLVTVFFDVALHLILVRLLIEVAAAILLRPLAIDASWPPDQTRRA
jgi:hypothetical protein